MEDRKINNIVKHFKYKKVTLIVVVVVIVGILVLLLLQTPATNKLPQGNRANVYQNNQQSAGQVENQIPTQTMQTVVYTAPRFTMEYPVGWTPTADAFNGGSFVMIHPALGSGWQGDPLIAVESYDAAANVDAKAEIFERMGFSKTVFLLNNLQGLQGMKLSGTWNMRVVDGKAFYGPTQERIIYLPQPSALYVIRYYYNGSQPIKANEDLLNKFLSSFQLN